MSKTFASRRGILVAAALLGTIGLSRVAKPNAMVADQLDKLDLAAVIPASFGGWRIDETTPVVLPSPDLQAALDKIYNQLVARTYINGEGQRVMLSLAYGRNQSDAVQAHKPEGCYQGQGFAVGPVETQLLNLSGRNVPVRRIVTSKFARVEPVTYYVLIGDTVSLSNWREKLVQMRYALDRKIPDGLLMRVSSIGPDTRREYQVQTDFLNALINSVPTAVRPRIIGTKSYL